MKKAIKNTTLADRALFLILLIISAAGFFYSGEALSLGSEVVVEVKGRPVYTLSLDVDMELEVEGSHGHGVVEIKKHKVRMKDAQCDNHICVRQGWISRGAIVCLPNDIVVIVEPGRKTDIDAITG